MSWVGRGAIAVVLATLALTTVGCASDGGSGQSESACASDFVYEGRTYVKLTSVEVKAGQKVGTATNPPCNDTNDQTAEEPSVTENAYAVTGISPDLAIAIGPSPDQAVAFAVLRSGSDFPPEVQELIDKS